MSLRQDFPSVFLITVSLTLPYLVLGFYLNKNNAKARRAMLLSSAFTAFAASVLAFNILFADFSYGGNPIMPYLTVVVVSTSVLLVVIMLIVKTGFKPVIVLLTSALALVTTSTLAFASTMPQIQGFSSDVSSVATLNLSGSSTMVAEEGAGPRAEFRGFSFEMCDMLSSRDCFITHYDEIALKQGVSFAVSDIITKVSNNIGRTFPSHCHQVVHNLGQMALEVDSNFEKAASLDPQVCGTGFTHGLWELIFNKLTDEQLFAQVSTICEDFNMVTDWYRWSCNHILGHMIMTKLMDNPSYAMEYCLSITGKNQSDCLAGGWMNYFQDDYVLANLKEKGSMQDLFNVCYGAKSGPVKFFCYQELFPAIYLLANRSDYEAGKACVEYSEASEKTNNELIKFSDDLNYTDRCVQGLARAVAVSTSYDFRKIPDRCLAMPEKVQDSCLKAAAASVVLNTGASSAGVAVCKHVKDEQARGYCYAWAKNSNSLLMDGPNSQNIPGFGDVVLPEGGTPLAPSDIS